MSWLSEGLHAIDSGIKKIPVVGGLIPSAASLVGGALVPGGNVVGSALNGTVGSDLAKGASNAGMILPVVGQFGGGGANSQGQSTTDTGGVYTDPNGGIYSDDGSIPVIPGASGPSSSGGTWQNILGDLAKVGGNIADLAKKYGTTAIEAAAIVQSAQQQAKAAKIADDAISSEQTLFAGKAPLRTAGQAGLLNPGANTPDLSNIRTLATTGSGNPFTKSLPVAGVATQAPGYDSTGKLNIPSALPVASGSLPSGITSSGNPLPPGAQGAVNSAAAQPANQAAQQGLSGIIQALKALPVAQPTPTTVRPKTLPVADYASEQNVNSPTRIA